VKIEVSNGEIVDRATILMIKAEKLPEPYRAELEAEMQALCNAMRGFGIDCSDEVTVELRRVNEGIWESIGRQEEILKFGKADLEFAKVSAEVVRLNRKRYELKRAIDEMTGSRTREFKQE